MATPAVLFSRGSSTRFPDVVKDPNTMYFITDTKEIYLGADRYAFGKDVVVSVTGVGDCVADIAWDVTTKTLTITKGNAADAISVRELIEDTLENYVMRVSAPHDSAISVDNTDAQNPIIDINFATGIPEEGNVKFGQCSEGLYANVEIPEVPIAEVAANDKILSVDHRILKSTLSITTTKDTTTDRTFIELQGIGGETISRFDATDFTKHGLLQSAKIEYRGNPPHPWLILTFLTDDGHSTGTDVVEVDVSNLVDIYTAKAGGGLKLEEGAFSIANEVTASSGVNSDVDLEFGRTTTLNTIMYDGHGNITGQKTFEVTMPSIGGGSVGNSDNSKLVTFVNIGTDGSLIGNAIDVVTELSASSTDNQIPTAKTVFDAVEDARPTWTTWN